MVSIDANALNHLLEKEGISQAELSTKLGYSVGYLSHAINERGGTLRKGAVITAAAILKVTPEYLILKEPEPTPEPKPAAEMDAVSSTVDLSELTEKISKLEEVAEAQHTLLAKLIQVQTEQSEQMARYTSIMSDSCQKAFVSQNQMLNKIFNQIKYGGK